MAKAKRPDYRLAADRLKAAAHPVRLRTLLILAEGPRLRHDLLAEVGASDDTSDDTLAPHLRMLAVAGLVESRAEGRRRAYALTDAGRDLLRVVASLAGWG